MLIHTSIFSIFSYRLKDLSCIFIYVCKPQHLRLLNVCYHWWVSQLIYLFLNAFNVVYYIQILVQFNIYIYIFFMNKRFLDLFIYQWPVICNIDLKKEQNYYLFTSPVVSASFHCVFLNMVRFCSVWLVLFLRLRYLNNFRVQIMCLKFMISCFTKYFEFLLRV